MTANAQYIEMKRYINHRMNTHLTLLTNDLKTMEVGGVSATGFERLEEWDADEFEEAVRREAEWRSEDSNAQTGRRRYLPNSHIFIIEVDEDAECDKYGQSLIVRVSSLWGSEAHRHRIQMEMADKTLDFIQHK
jgi:hypothetical protein